MRDTSNLSPRMHVHIRAFDDTPSHQFLVEEVFEGCITGPLAGEYGEPDIELVLRSSHQTAAEGLRELLKP